MALRVYDLAKELKISSAALMKHLNDMSVEVKSHMKYLDDDTADKVRQKFKQEVEQIKKLETERKLIQEQLRNKEKVVKESKNQKIDSPFKEDIVFEEKETVVSPFSDDNKNSKKHAESKKSQSFIENNNSENNTIIDGSQHSNRNTDKQTFVTQSQNTDRSSERNSSSTPSSSRYDKSSSQERPNRSDSQRNTDRQSRSDGQRNYDRPNRPDGQRNYDRSNNQDGQRSYDRPNRPDGQRNYDRSNSQDGQRSYDRPNRPDGQRNYDRSNNQDGQRSYDRPNRPDGQRTYDRSNNQDGQRSYDRPNRPDGQRTYDRSNNQDGQRSYDRPNRPDGQRTYDRPNRPDGQRTYDRPNRPDGQRTYDRPNRPDGQRSYDRQSRPDGQRSGSYDSTRSQNTQDKFSQRVSFPKAGIIKPEIKEIPEEKVFGKKKVTVDDLGDKSKHLQAKLKNSKKRKKGGSLPEVDEAVLEKNIKLTLSGSKKRKKYKKEDKKVDIVEELSEIKVSEFTSVSELAKVIDVSPSEIITKFFQMGKMVSINQRLDKDSLELICSEYELDICFHDEFGTDILQDKIDDLNNIEEKSRPPVVTIMGHVDHGKTSILDRIRNTKVVHGESGGITQHIGAYQAVHNGQKVTFIDTPGHEAFTAMRARGANITDVAVIVVAANDGVKPQTIEAIDHARAAGVTMIIAVNKIDLPEANIDRTVASLLEQNVFLEGYGGQIPWIRCSAITGEGIDELLEIILLSAEMKELKARFNGPGKGIVIESEKNSRMGAKATILLQEGILKKGDNIVVGSCFGHVRKLENERCVELSKISPADIAVVYGLNDVPKAGDILNVVENERIARQIGGERLLIRQEREKYQSKTNLGNLFSKIKQNEMTELRLIIKADVDGSVEAVCDSLQKLSTDEIKVTIIRKSVGGIIEADVNLASASDAIIIGFNVRANNKAKKLAEDTGVEVKFYQIIFEAIEDIKKAMIGMLSPEFKEKILGQALIKQVFKIKKIGTIAGCAVEKGYIQANSKLRLYRDDKVVYTGEMDKLKHYNESVNEVKSGTECGISIKNYSDIKEGDVIECFVLEEVARQL